MVGCCVTPVSMQGCTCTVSCWSAPRGPGRSRPSSSWCARARPVPNLCVPVSDAFVPSLCVRLEISLFGAGVGYRDSNARVAADEQDDGGRDAADMGLRRNAHAAQGEARCNAVLVRVCAAVFLVPALVLRPCRYAAPLYATRARGVCVGTAQVSIRRALQSRPR